MGGKTTCSVNYIKYFLTDKQIEVFARGVSTLELGLLQGGE